MIVLSVIAPAQNRALWFWGVSADGSSVAQGLAPDQLKACDRCQTAFLEWVTDNDLDCQTPEVDLRLNFIPVAKAATKGARRG